MPPSSLAPSQMKMQFVPASHVHFLFLKLFPQLFLRISANLISCAYLLISSNLISNLVLYLINVYVLLLPYNTITGLLGEGEGGGPHKNKEVASFMNKVGTCVTGHFSMMRTISSIMPIS